ncbi:aspartate aminotransferase family protein [Chitinophaga rhizophila]|uniref:Aspartate aminotransferase family protein n=1 Tax=Chitinophaga rhizophila TaxID=2866212 RepID=A0ABS7GKP1_9BACT|nr:aspartate aminotransferase family protein [Chitinophaga rhizophila]MBW8687212.1 aspartate aminotransferase family protein [Chitinophaga rhizophila]
MSKFESFHLAQQPSILTDTIPGPRSQALIARQQLLESSIVSYPKGLPIALKRAKGAIVEDADGNQFIDFFSMAGVLNVGHVNPYVLEYVRKQQEELIHVLDFPTENKLDLIEKILAEFPDNVRDQFKVAFCASTGSDAVEAAIKLAKHKTGREGVIAFHGSYHGMTSGALSVTSHTQLRSGYKSLLPNITFLPYSYCYRCPFNHQKETCKLDCAEYFRYVLENPHSGVVKPAAVILEPIQGEGGTVIPKEGFLEKIIHIARKHDVMVIFDEIQSGFFRTGNFMAYSNPDALPDIITMSKGLGGIGFPVSAIVYNKAVESWAAGDHIGTFRGNQVSIAGGNGAFDFIKEYEVEAHVKEMGAYLLARLQQLMDQFSCIGEVRGRGLFVGVEYVKDRYTKKPDAALVKKLRQECLQRGLIFETGGHYNNVVRFLPPLIVNKEIIDSALQIFEDAHHAIAAVPAAHTLTEI